MIAGVNRRSVALDLGLRSLPMQRDFAITCGLVHNYFCFHSTQGITVYNGVP